MEKEIKEIIHKYAAWAASRAASVNGCRFSVEIGQQILNEVAIRNFILNPDALPNSASEFNLLHKQWREHIIELSKSKTCPDFTHGVAAKLINIYLKTILTCGGFHSHEKVSFIHPPIDSLLMEALVKASEYSYNKKFREVMRAKCWSKFSSDDYEAVIQELQNVIGEKPLWSIEKYWKGHQ